MENGTPRSGAIRAHEVLPGSHAGSSTCAWKSTAEAWAKLETPQNRARTNKTRRRDFIGNSSKYGCVGAKSASLVETEMGSGQPANLGDCLLSKHVTGQLKPNKL